jgi:hypothetical protein
MGPDEVAAELYVVAPGEFVERRDARARELREAGDKKLAAEVKKWRRPLVAAWVVNLLAWERPEQLEKLLALGTDLVAAQRDRDAASIRTLTDRKQRLVQALVQQGRELAEEAGQPIGAAVGYEVEGTLNAALSDPDAAERVRSGRLERPESYAGFGPFGEAPNLWLVPDDSPAPERRSGTRSTIKRGSRPEREPEPSRPPAASAKTARERARAEPSRPPAASAKTARERARAERAVADAQAVLAEAEQRHTDALAAVDDAEEAWRDLGERADELRSALAELDRRLVEAELDRRRLARVAERTAAEVQRARRRAESAASRLGDET